MRKVTNNKHPYIIAEIGINHNGDHDIAILMTELAIKAGASAIKYQLFDPELLVTRNTEMAKYQKENSNKLETQYEMLKRNVIQLKTLNNCKKICKFFNVDFICTAFDEKSLETVIKLKPALLKWPSGEIDNLELLSKACKTKIPIIISTGMADENEIDLAVKTCIKNGLETSEITLLHCTSQYPTKISDANMLSISFLKDKFPTRVGFSDHTMGYFAAQLALSMGATVFEKHVSLSRMMDGVDHIASANFDEFKQYVEKIKETSVILGEANKKCLEIEKDTKKVARKSIIAKSNITKGNKFTHDNLISKRPGTGISPIYLKDLLKKKASRNIMCDQILSWEDVD